MATRLVFAISRYIILLRDDDALSILPQSDVLRVTVPNGKSDRLKVLRNDYARYCESHLWPHAMT
jgi:hypothetical protein